MEHSDMTRTRLFIGLETAENLEIAPEEVIDRISEYVEGGTFYEGKGLWKGSTENSIVFEVVGLKDSMTIDFMDELEESNTDDPAEYLKAVLESEFDQDSVMVEKTGVEVGF